MIPEAAVEAAGLAWCGKADLAGWQRRHITKLLEAAAPAIRAQALRGAATTFGACEPEGSYSSTPTQVIDWLRYYAELQ